MSEYIIVNGELYHAEGKERKNHKYYARELVKKVGGRNVYKYYYTRDEFLASRNGNHQKKNHIQTSEERYRAIQNANHQKKNHIQTSEERYRAIQNANYQKKNHIQTSEERHRAIQNANYSKKNTQTSSQVYRQKFNRNEIDTYLYRDGKYYKRNKDLDKKSRDDGWNEYARDEKNGDSTTYRLRNSDKWFDSKRKTTVFGRATHTTYTIEKGKLSRLREKAEKWLKKKFDGWF